MQFGWTANEDTSKHILSAAYEAGINFIDTADIYSRWVDGNPGGISESIIGRWIKESTIPRHNLIIATKVRGLMGRGPNDEGLSRVHIMQAVEDSLLRLETDYIDLYQTHWPDENTPIEETLSALDDLTRQGKVRYIGCSNYPAWRLTDAIWTAKHHHLTGYISLQPHFNLVHREEFEREMADVCRHFGLGVIPYSPLAGGFLTGKYRKGELHNSARAGSASRYFTDRNWVLLEKMETLGKNKGGYSISQIALAWLLSNPLVTSLIIGPRSINQLQDNLGAVDVKLDLDEKDLLDKLSSWK
jgi:aryl-alcohol dehydrogenase-like predicted oxidoreductase